MIAPASAASATRPRTHRPRTHPTANPALAPHRDAPSRRRRTDRVARLGRRTDGDGSRLAWTGHYPRMPQRRDTPAGRARSRRLDLPTHCSPVGRRTHDLCRVPTGGCGGRAEHAACVRAQSCTPRAVCVCVSIESRATANTSLLGDTSRNIAAASDRSGRANGWASRDAPARDRAAHVARSLRRTLYGTLSTPRGATQGGC